MLWPTRALSVMAGDPFDAGPADDWRFAVRPRVNLGGPGRPVGSVSGRFRGGDGEVARVDAAFRGVVVGEDESLDGYAPFGAQGPDEFPHDDRLSGPHADPGRPRPAARPARHKSRGGGPDVSEAPGRRTLDTTPVARMPRPSRRYR